MMSETVMELLKQYMADSLALYLPLGTGIGFVTGAFMCLLGYAVDKVQSLV